MASRIVGYYCSWAVYRPGQGKYDVDQIDPTLFTHLIFSFAGLNGDDIKVLDSWNDLERDGGALKKFVKLKNRNPRLKTLIAIGGWKEESKKFSDMASSETGRKKFAINAVVFFKKYGFDGLDMDWEYPNQRGGKPADVQNFVKLLKEMRAVFNKHNLILSAAVAAAELSMSISYNVPELSKYLDMINIMTYDLHGHWDKKTGQNAPLHMSTLHDKSSNEKMLNVKSCIDIWIAKGADPRKINLGLATYGRSFTLNNPSNTGLGSPANEPGNAGTYTREAGILGYNEIVEKQKNENWKIVWNEEQKVPYMYKGNQWVGYDDPKSIKLKVEYAKSKGIGGVMVWTVETDDFQSQNPLLTTIKQNFF